MIRTTLRRMTSSSPPNRLVPLFALGLLDHPPIWPVPLPPKRCDRHTLVLDIDETLLHTYTSDPAADMDGVRCTSFLFLPRPHLREFLAEVMERFEVIFWTAGTASYCSAMVDALEQHVLGLPVSIYNRDEIVKASNGRPSTEHVNFLALSRTQTLEEHDYMKYLPILGRPLHRVIMIDDNERSFPLTPRHGIKISTFAPDSHIMYRYSEAMALQRHAKTAKKKKAEMSAELRADVERGEAVLARWEKDTALRDLLPLLRHVADAPDAARELDYWRTNEYKQCDNFRETMNPRSVTRTKVLGVVSSKRRASPIPKLRAHVANHAFTHEASVHMKELYRKTHLEEARKAKL